MAFVSRSADGRTHLNVRSLDRADTIRLAGTEGARGPFLSPDGRWLGFWADGKLKKIAVDGDRRLFSVRPATFLARAGIERVRSWEIYVRRIPDDGTKVRVSTSGGVVPYWSPNGHELIYRTDANRVMVVSYKTVGESFTVGTPRPWSQHTLMDAGVLPNFAVDASGERILALMSAPAKDPQSANHVTVILNFDEEVRRRAAAR